MSSKEEEERFLRLTSENEELKMKIAEKERQIDEVKRKIEQMTKEQLERRRIEEKCTQVKSSENVRSTLKKAVRIQEPGTWQEPDNLCDNNNGKSHSFNEMHIDPTSDSGFVSNKNSRPSEVEFSESYL